MILCDFKISGSGSLRIFVFMWRSYFAVALLVLRAVTGKVNRSVCDCSDLIYNPLTGNLPPLAALDFGSLDLTGTNVTLALAVGLIPSDEPVRAGAAVGATVCALLLLVLSLTWLRARRRRMRLLRTIRPDNSVVRTCAVVPLQDLVCRPLFHQHSTI